MFGINTKYHYSNKYMSNEMIDIQSKYNVDIIKGYLVSRHGAHFPSKESYNRMKELKGFLRSKLLPNLHLEKLNYINENDYLKLAFYGSEEQQNLGKRISITCF